MDVGALLLLLAFAVAYGLICRWIGDYAASKGQSYWAFAILSLLITPVWGFVIAAIAPDQSQRRVPEG